VNQARLKKGYFFFAAFFDPFEPPDFEPPDFEPPDFLAAFLAGIISLLSLVDSLTTR